MNHYDAETSRGQDADPVDELLHAALGGDAPAELDGRLDSHFEELRCRLSATQPTRRTTFIRVPSVRTSLKGLCAVVSLSVIILAAVLLLGPSNLTWADVVERFRGVSHFGAVVFTIDSPLDAPEKIEIWMNSGRRSRVHHAGRVYFGEGKRTVRVFDAASGKEIDLESLSSRERYEQGFSKPIGMIRMMGSMEEFQLNALLGFFAGKTKLTSPLRNSEASISNDMFVFDAESTSTPEWFRIWVLQSSGLPVRMKYWDPRRGESMDVLFEYMDEQPCEAFDPDVFKQTLSRKDSQANRVYSLLTDPGGRMLSPEDIFEQSGYHMPTVRERGRTKDGVFWVVSSSSTNKTPNGRRFYGFGRLIDSLGQEYFHVVLGQRVKGDVTVEYFVPFAYGIDFEKPTSYTLTCWAQPDHWEQRDDIVGSIDVTEWKEDVPIPAARGEAPSDDEPLKNLLREYVARHNWDRFDQLLALIPGDPADSPLAFFREIQRLRKMQAMENDDEALAISSRLYPLVNQYYERSNWDFDVLVRSHVELLVKHDQQDQAGIVVRTHLDRLGGSDSNAARYFERIMLGTLLCRGVTIETINELFGFDTMAVPKLAEEANMLRREGRVAIRFEDNPRYQDWRDYVNKIAQRYDKQPLPESVDLLFDVKPFDAKKPAYRRPLPGHPGYTILRVSGQWKILMMNLCLKYDWNSELTGVTKDLVDETVNVTCVMKEDLQYGDAIERLIEHDGLYVAERTVPCSVWIARYDGRQLPYWRDVRPLDASHLGTKRVCQAGGTSTTARSVLTAFERAINFDRSRFGSDAGKVHIVDETGLPTKPGKNQTYGTICLAYHYAFWAGDEAIAMAEEWFEENFGITFQKETRDLTVHELERMRFEKATSQSKPS